MVRRIAIPTAHARPSLPATPSFEQIRRWRPFWRASDTSEVKRIFATSKRDAWRDTMYGTLAVFELAGDQWVHVEPIVVVALPNPPTPDGPVWRCHWGEDATFIVPRHVFAQPWFDVALDAELAVDRDATRTIVAEFVPPRVLSLAVAIVAKVARSRRNGQKNAVIDEVT